MISFMESNPNLAVGNVLGRAAAGNLWTNLATLLNEHGVWEADARLKSRTKVEVDPDVRMVSVLVVGGVLDCQDVERY